MVSQLFYLHIAYTIWELSVKQFHNDISLLSRFVYDNMGTQVSSLHLCCLFIITTMSWRHDASHLCSLSLLISTWTTSLRWRYDDTIIFAVCSCLRLHGNYSFCSLLCTRISFKGNSILSSFNHRFTSDKVVLSAIAMLWSCQELLLVEVITN